MKTRVQFIFLTLLVFLEISSACTHPKQLQGILADAIATKKMQPGAKLDLLELGIRYYYDSVLQKIRLDENIDGTRITVIQDYKRHKSYTIINGDKCTSSNLTQRFPDYPPQDIKSLGTFEFGGSRNKIQVDGYSFIFQGTSVQLFFNSKNCIPVAETAYIQMPNQLSLSAIAFSNMTASITDPSVFNLPPVCSEFATTTLERFDPIHHARLRFAERHVRLH
ncbi:uncharacterized protein TRIADDRAFT_53034 [Trichoplax adhaerens]|uniref:NtA domain-containing protein n=1 Tax=Trichoplax adhaerens TaxID=10228 RepID=B3RN45_TRIAD|nr:predicted protein [Trichoplax adhaerens]EDV27389.1 predicted protein [Trichoplax adhaerens]|eukprot:XP_002109223.1 predicted protein [Trichoplax adhaerens]